MLVCAVISDAAADHVGGARWFLRCKVTAFLLVSDFQSDSLKPFRYPFLHHTVALLFWNPLMTFLLKSLIVNLL